MVGGKCGKKLAIAKWVLRWPRPPKWRRWKAGLRPMVLKTGRRVSNRTPDQSVALWMCATKNVTQRIEEEKEGCLLKIRSVFGENETRSFSINTRFDIKNHNACQLAKKPHTFAQSKKTYCQLGKINHTFAFTFSDTSTEAVKLISMTGGKLVIFCRGYNGVFNEHPSGHQRQVAFIEGYHNI